MSSAKLLRYRRSSYNQKKRKTQEKAKNAKRRWSHNACATIMEREIGGGCFETCYLAKFGACTVVVKQQQNSQAIRQKARMTARPARLRHPNTACFIGNVGWQNRVETGPLFTTSVVNDLILVIFVMKILPLTGLTLLAVCRGIQHIHDKAKILHNDMKSNSRVLDGCSLAEAEAALVDFGKATV